MNFTCLTASDNQAFEVALHFSGERVQKAALLRKLIQFVRQF